MKKVIIAAGLAFLSGVYCSDTANEIRGLIHYETKEGFSEHPYNLRIVHRKTSEGIESYVLDTKTNEYWKVKDKGRKDYLLDKIIIDYILDYIFQ